MLLEQNGVEEVVINTHRFADTIRHAVEELETTMNTHFFHEEELLETGGGIKQALPVLGEDGFFVVNGDVVWVGEQFPLLSKLGRTFDPDEMDPTFRTSGTPNYLFTTCEIEGVIACWI